MNSYSAFSGKIILQGNKTYQYINYHMSQELLVSRNAKNHLELELALCPISRQMSAPEGSARARLGSLPAVYLPAARPQVVPGVARCGEERRRTNRGPLEVVALRFPNILSFSIRHCRILESDDKIWYFN